MGSLNVTCLVTGLPLAEEPAVLVPLVPNGVSDPNRPTAAGGSMILLNSPWDMFGPATLPLYGRVDDAGGLEEVEETPNVAILRKRLGGEEAFSRFLRNLRLGENPEPTFARLGRRTKTLPDVPAWRGNLSGTWVSRRAYEIMSRTVFESDGSEAGSAYAGGKADRETMRAGGFRGRKFSPEIAERAFEGIPKYGPGAAPDRIEALYRSEALGTGVRVWTDREANFSVDVRGRGIVGGGRTFAELDRVLGSAGFPLPPEVVEAMKARSRFRSGIESTGKWFRKTRILRKQLRESGVQPGRMFDWDCGIGDQEIPGLTPELKLLYRGALYRKELSPEIEKWAAFVLNLGSSGRYLTPLPVSPQSPYDDLSERIARETLRAIGERRVARVVAYYKRGVLTLGEAVGRILSEGAPVDEIARGTSRFPEFAPELGRVARNALDGGSFWIGSGKTLPEPRPEILREVAARFALPAYST